MTDRIVELYSCTDMITLLPPFVSDDVMVDEIERTFIFEVNPNHEMVTLLRERGGILKNFLEANGFENVQLVYSGIAPNISTLADVLETIYQESQENLSTPYIMAKALEYLLTVDWESPITL